MRLTLCEAPTPETRPDHNTGNYVQDTITIRALRLTCNTQYFTRFNTLLIEENQKLKQNSITHIFCQLHVVSAQAEYQVCCVTQVDTVFDGLEKERKSLKTQMSIRNSSILALAKRVLLEVMLHMLRTAQKDRWKRVSRCWIP